MATDADGKGEKGEEVLAELTRLFAVDYKRARWVAE